MFNLESDIARKILQLKAFYVQINSPILWGNGWKAPIYFDDRKILSYPQVRNYIELELARLVAEHYPDADVIAAIASNAIAHGMLVAEKLGLPFVSVYHTPKDHGLENQIEGDLRPHQKVVIIENQIANGIHAVKVSEAIRDSGCSVLGVVTLMDFNLASAAQRFNMEGLEVVSLTNFNTVIQEAEKMHIISTDALNVIVDWHRAPSKWKK